MDAMPQAHLPPSYIERRIQDLVPGETGCTFPGVVSADADGRLWLYVPFKLEPCARWAALRVTKETDGTWTVDCTQCDRPRFAVEAVTNSHEPVARVRLP